MMSASVDKKVLNTKALSGRLIAIMVAVFVVASIASAGFLGTRYAEAAREESARSDAVTTAREVAESMFGYNAATIEENIATSLRALTGDARAMYERTMAEGKVAEEVKRQQVVSQVAIQEAGIVTSNADSATVLIFMNSSVSRGDNELIRVDPSRVNFDMVKRDDRWLITTIDVITDDTFRSLLDQTDTPPEGAVELTPEGPDPATPDPATPDTEGP